MTLEKMAAHELPVILFVVVACLAPIRAQEYNELLRTLYGNVLTVINYAQVPASVKDRMRVDFSNVFSPENTKKLTVSTDERDVIEAIHDAAHNIIDNLDLPNADVVTLHSSVHHVFSATFVGSSCYKSFTSLHTGCLKDDVCVKLKTGVSVPDRDLIVGVHNLMRRRVALGLASEEDDSESLDDIFGNFQPKAARMKEMVWDVELANLAQKWANQCQARVDCLECRRVPRFAVGQNLFYVLLRKNQAAPKWNVALQEWFAQKKNFPHDVVYRYEHSNSWAAYTQLVWDKTYRVGCGYSSFQDGRGIRHLFVCNYGPRGNIPGQPVYATGNPCSKCPRGHICNELKLCSYGSPPPGFNPLDPSNWLKNANNATLAAQEQDAETSSAIIELLQDFNTTSQPSPAAASDSVCHQGCVPIKYLNLCDHRTFRKGTDCQENYVCCTLLLQSSSDFRLPAQSTTTTERTLPESCPGQCIKLTEANKRCRGAMDYRVNTCELDEACCTRRLDDLSFADTIGSSVPLANKSERDMSRRKSSTCPTTHACLPMDVAGLCDPEEILQKATCTQRDHLCCEVKPSMLETCASHNLSCVPRTNARFICADKSIDESKLCPTLEAVCCWANETLILDNPGILDNVIRPLSFQTSSGSSSSSRTPDPLRCDSDAGSECLPRYNNARCKSQLFRREFTDIFSCDDPALACCAPIRRIEARIYETLA